MGTSLSGPTVADGASAFYNPAAMGAGRGTHLELDGGLVLLGLEYAPNTGPAPSSTSAIAPLLTLGGFTDALDPDWRIGLTVSIPRTSGGSWDREDGAGEITRYYLVSGATFHIQAVPAVSWSPAEWITIGLGANLVYGSLSGELDKDFGSQLNQTAGSPDIDLPFPYAHPDLAAPVTLDGSGFGIGAIGGVLVRPIPELSIGLSVHSPVIILGEGNLDVTYPQRLRDFVAATLPTATLPELATGIDMDLDIPTIVIAGISARPHEMLDLAANYTYENSASQANFYTRVSEDTNPDSPLVDTAKPQAYSDRHRAFFRVAFLPVPELRIAAHGVVQSNTIPDDTFAPNNVDFDRVEVGLAVRWRIVDEFSLTAQYSHIVLFDRIITDSLHVPRARPTLTAFNHPSPTGIYVGAADTIRLGVAVHFDQAADPVEEEEEPVAEEPRIAPADPGPPAVSAEPAPTYEEESEDEPEGPEEEGF